MKKILIIFNLAFLIFNPVGFAQDQTKIDSLKQVLSIAKQDTNKVKTLLKLGYQYEYTTPDTALSYYKKALSIAKNIKAKKHIAKCLYYIGIVFMQQKSNYPKALIYFQKALKIYEEIDYKIGIAINFGNIGIIYINQSNYEKALEYFQKALKIYEEIDDKDGIATNFGNIGIVYSDQSNYEKAIEYYGKALKIQEEIRDKSGIAANLGNIGNIYNYQSNYEKALEYFQKALKINKETDNKNYIAVNLGNIGIVYNNQGNYDKALEYYGKALKIQEEIGDKLGITRNLVNIGSLYNDLKQYNKVIEYEKQALIVAKEIGALRLEKNAYSYLSKANKGLNNYKKALEYKDKWIELNDSIFNTEKTKAIAEMSTRYETAKKEKQIIQQQAELKTSQLQTEKEKAEKQRQQTQRNMFIIAFALMLILALFVYRSYIQKQKANKILARQKQQISEANDELNQQAEELQLLNENLNQQNEEITAQRDEITKQKEIVEEIHHEISQSIDYATRLQGAILPETKVLEKHLSDYFVLFKPKDKVSGDFYWWANVEKHTVITAADSTGHGVPGAFMSMLGASFLREIVQKEYVTHTGVILRKLRKEIIKSLKQKGEPGEQKDGMDMAIISIDHETNIVQFSGANNPLYVIKNGELKIESESSDAVKFYELDELSKFKLYEVKPDKMPIAIYEKMDAFTTHEIQLEKGDQLYMFSDGFADQFGGPKGKKFKYKPFKSLLLENIDKPMAEQKEILNLAFENWKGDLEQIDDVVVLGIKI